MGIGRGLIRNLVPFARHAATIKNMVEEKSVVEGIKKTAREDICEDNPLTSRIYATGKYDGKKEGYVEASEEYEEKLLSQANEFLKQKTIFESQRDEYEKLLDDYENEINRLESLNVRTQEETEYLKELLLSERQLIKMK